MRFLWYYRCKQSAGSSGESKTEVNAVRAEEFNSPTNPYHYVLHCIGGKWKMTILHEIYTHGSIRFNQTLKTLPISEKVFSQQLRELVAAGLIRRISYDTVPPKVEYVLTPSGEQLIPAVKTILKILLPNTSRTNPRHSIFLNSLRLLHSDLSGFFYK